MVKPFYILCDKSSTLEKQDSHLSHVEIDEMLSFMGHVGAEVPSNYYMPSRIVFFIELFLDESLDV